MPVAFRAKYFRSIREWKTTVWKDFTLHEKLLDIMAQSYMAYRNDFQYPSLLISGQKTRPDSVKL